MVSLFLSIAFVHFLALVSPGPDFVMVVKNALVYGKNKAIVSCFGLGCGVLIHCIYSVIGLSAVLTQNQIVFKSISYLGSFYLCYLAFHLFTGSKNSDHLQKISTYKPTTNWKMFKQGFLINILNPKAVLFFLTLFTQVITPETSSIFKIIVSIELVFASIFWYGFVAFVFSNNNIRQKYFVYSYWVEKVLAILLLLLVVKILFY